MSAPRPSLTVALRELGNTRGRMVLRLDEAAADLQDMREGRRRTVSPVSSVAKNLEARIAGWQAELAELEAAMAWMKTQNVNASDTVKKEKL